jgi:hypothetical protein
VYTATKVAATRLASAYHHTHGLPVSHVRAFNAFGPGQAHGPGHPQKIIPTFAVEAWAGRPIPIWGDGNQTVDLIHTSDLARMLVDAIDHGDDVTFDDLDLEPLTAVVGFGSITGRLGYTWGPAMIYVKGGYAYSDNRETLLLGGVPQAFAFDKNHRDGWTVGAGLEYMFAQNWSAKAEYMYYNFGDTRFVTPAVLVPFGTFHNDEHTLKLGVNYRFNFGGPVVARY